MIERFQCTVLLLIIRCLHQQTDDEILQPHQLSTRGYYCNMKPHFSVDLLRRSTCNREERTISE